MPRQRLTLPRIAAFNPKAEGLLWDEDMPRLALRARPSGAKSFIFKGTLNYKDIKVTIGAADAWTIEGAREEARRYQRWIDEGKDPREVLRQEAEARAAEEAQRQAAAEAARIDAQRQATPALEAWKVYLESRRAKWGERSYADHLAVSKEGGELITRGRKKTKDGKTLPGALRPLLQLPLNQIDAARVHGWLVDEVERRPTHAALAFRLLRAFLRWCAGKDAYRACVHVDACAAKDVRDELPQKAAKRDALLREQLALWFHHVRQLPNPTHAAYLQVLLLVGSRREELAELRWDDVDFRWGKLRLKDKVEEEGREIPLTPYVAALLRDLKARNETPPAKARKLRQGGGQAPEEWKPAPWVFASPGAASGRIVEPRISHNRALAAAGLPPVTLHGLRRSFGTLAEWVECPVGIVAQIQGHKPSATAEKHYRVRPIDLLRLWHTRIEAWILEQAGIEQPKEESRPGLRVVAS